jgi:hypothetical protein
MMVENTGLENLCEVVTNPFEMRKKIVELMQVEFKTADIRTRDKILSENFSNDVNAQKLLNLIYPSGQGLFSQL